MSQPILQSSPHRVIGVVQLMVAGQRHMLSIESAEERSLEGFYIDSQGEGLIRVPEGASPRELDQRVSAGLQEAIKHFSRSIMN